MYKITNKLTNFIQYRNKVDLENFIIINSRNNKKLFHDKYKIEKLKELNTDTFEEILYTTILLFSSLTLFYYIVKVFVK